MLRMVPGGVVALEGSGGTPSIPFRLLSDRNRSVRVLTPPANLAQGSVDCGISFFSATWPVLIVVTGWTASGTNGCDDKQGAIVYTSDTGGKSWSITGRTPTTP
jgi:hypothetical protein